MTNLKMAISNAHNLPSAQTMMNIFFTRSHCKYAFDEKEKACRRTESKIKKKYFVKKIK